MIAIACPCCGYLTFKKINGSYDICPVCYWEDDPVQNNEVDYGGGANVPSLNQARGNYELSGAIEKRFLEYVRDPLPKEMPK